MFFVRPSSDAVRFTKYVDEGAHAAISDRQHDAPDRYSFIKPLQRSVKCEDCHSVVAHLVALGPIRKALREVLSYDRNGVNQHSLTAASLVWGPGFSKHVQ
jgi:hypothetical protein